MILLVACFVFVLVNRGCAFRRRTGPRTAKAKRREREPHEEIITSSFHRFVPTKINVACLILIPCLLFSCGQLRELLLLLPRHLGNRLIISIAPPNDLFHCSKILQHFLFKWNSMVQHNLRWLLIKEMQPIRLRGDTRSTK